MDDVLLIQGSGPHVDHAQVEKEVIVDLHCGAAVLRGADIFVPGVMAAPLSTAAPQCKSTITSFSTGA